MPGRLVGNTEHVRWLPAEGLLYGQLASPPIRGMTTQVARKVPISWRGIDRQNKNPDILLAIGFWERLCNFV